MKTIAAVAAVAVMLLATRAAAQRADESMVWRIQAGVNSSTLSGSDAELADLNRRQALIIGVTNLAHVTRRIGVEFGAFYSQKGVEVRVEETEGFDVPFVSGIIEGTVYLHYLEFPLVLNVWLPVGERFSLCAYAGPAGAIRTSAEISGVEGSRFLNGGSSVDLSSYTTNFDFMGIVGATVVVETGPVNLLLGLRWARSLRSVDDSVLGLDVFNSTFSALAGVGLPLRAGDEGGHRTFQ